MIKYVEKGIGLHEEITKKGYLLYFDGNTWVSDNDTAVQEIIDSYTPPIAQDWDTFNYLMLQDADFNTVFAAAQAISPLLTASLPAALTQVSSGQVTMFTSVFSLICQMGKATPIMRTKWAGFATSTNLNHEFVSILLGY